MSSGSRIGAPESSSRAHSPIEIETTPNVGNEESAKFIQGVCHKNDELLILVDLEKLMTDEEWTELHGL